MNFKDYINRETKTINEFNDSFSAVTITNILNDSFSTYDFEFTSGTTVSNFQFNIDGVGEVKTRNYSSTHYGDGVLLEVNKFHSLVNEAAKRKNNPDNINKIISPFYLVKYTDKTYLFNLEKVTFGPIVYSKCPVTTATNGSDEFVTKCLFLLNEDDAILTY